MAPGVTTYLRFDAPLDRNSLEVVGPSVRFRFVDVGERLVALEPLTEPDPEERVTVRVRYQEGGVPAFAAFTLVSDATRVDKEVEVVRRPRTVAALEAVLAERDAELAALRARSGLAELVFSGRLDGSVQIRRFESMTRSTQEGLWVMTVMGYRAKAWALAVVRVRNLPGQSPWRPTEARLTRADGTQVRVRSMDVSTTVFAPGAEGLIVVETEVPRWDTGEPLRLELQDKGGGRRLILTRVML